MLVERKDDPVEVELAQEDLNENQIIKSFLGSCQKFKKKLPISKPDDMPGELLYN